MNTGERVQSYANAFFEAAVERWLDTLHAAATALASGQHGRLADLQAGGAGFAQQQRALDGLLPSDADPLVRNLLYTLAQHDDLDLVGEVTEALRVRVRQVGSGPIPVEVLTAIALSDDQRAALEAKLAAQYGAALSYTYRVDPAILGGMIVRVGDKLMDGSVASKLAAMKQALGVTGS